jgi:hypothetical protein
MNPGYEANNRALWWIMGLIAALVLAITGFTFQSIVARISTLESIVAGRGERIAAIEQKITAMEKRNDYDRDDLQKRLDSIDNRLSTIEKYAVGRAR